MFRRRLVPAALLVTLLLAVVAIAARGRPLDKNGGGGGTGLPNAFWSFLFTTLVIVAALLALIALVFLVLMPRERMAVPNYSRNSLRTIVALTLGAALLAYVARHFNLARLHPPGANTNAAVTTPGIRTGTRPPRPPAHVHFQWEEVVIVLVLLLALGAAAWATRARLGAGTRRGRPAPETLAAALDESLDDLRNDPDLRRAIIAAYARLETALGAAGIPRDPAEAPLEYVERALLTLDASASAVRRLTDLFEWARFSHHEPEPSMRDEAIDALLAVRDELRASELALA